MRLAVFDLDYTVWHPEMYQLWGPPKLVPIESIPSIAASPTLREETKTDQKGMILVDRDRTPMRVFDGASYALSDINRMKARGYDIQAAISSRTDEPSWARICLNHLVIADGTVLKDCFPERLREISKEDKTKHIQRLHSKTGIAYEEICFFDNERWNIQQVSKQLPLVKCFYTPQGMTREAWDKAKVMFDLTSGGDDSNEF